MQECTPDVFAEDAAVLVLDKEMLAEARPKLLVSGMGPDPYKRFVPCAVSPFSKRM
jgi:hypothetical protein